MTTPDRTALSAHADIASVRGNPLPADSALASTPPHSAKPAVSPVKARTLRSPVPETFPIRAVAAVLAAACMLLLATACLGGCKTTDSFTEVVYDQTAAVIDESNTLYSNSPDAQQESDQLPALELSEDSDRDSEKTEVSIEYMQGSHHEYVLTRPDEKAVELDKAPEPDPVQDNNAPDSPTGTGTAPNTNSTSGAPSKSKSNGSSQAKSSTKTSKKKTRRKGSGDSGAEDLGTNGGNVDKDKVVVYDDSGEVTEVPENVKSVVAAGEAAHVALMLGGCTVDGAEHIGLIGADKDYLERSAKVMKAKGIGKVIQAWSGDGAKTTKADLKRIVKIHPDAVLYLSGSSTFTEKQLATLNKAGIAAILLPDTLTPTHIKRLVATVGTLLEKGGNADAAKLADEYAAFHDEAIDTCLDEAGGMTGGYDYDINQTVTNAASKTLFTVYIEDWDETARYKGAGSTLKSKQGVGVAAIGWKTSPLSYYLAAGGAVNNGAYPAARWSRDSRKVYVWQFSQTNCKISASLFEDSGIDTNPPYTSEDFTYSLLAAKAEGHNNNGFAYGFGVEEFPYVLVKTKSMRASMVKDSKSSTGIYRAFPAMTTGSGTVLVGTTGGQIACIGVYGERAGTQTISSIEDKVLVNPVGQSGESWTDGSVESVLESLWVSSMFRGLSHAKFADKVQEFYKTFYGYANADLDAIEAGA